MSEKQSELSEVIVNTSKNTNSVVLNTSKNTNSVIVNTSNNTKTSVLKKLDEVEALVTPDINDVDVDVTPEIEETVRKYMQSQVDKPDSDPTKILGGMHMIVGQSNKVKTITVGKQKSPSGDLIDYKDDTLMPIASGSKIILIMLVNRLVQKGYLSLTDEVSYFVPGWKNLVLLEDMNVQLDGKYCKKADGSQQKLFNSDNTPNWETPEELQTIKDGLTKLNRNITVQDLLYHTHGFAAGVFSGNFSSIGLHAGCEINAVSSNFEMIFNYPNTLGCSARQPGTSILYDTGSLMLSGVIEIIYNNVVNGLEVKTGMNLDVKYMTLGDILYEELAKDIGCERTDFSIGPVTIGSADYLRTSASLTGNISIYVVDSAESALSQLLAAGIPIGDITTTTKIFPLKGVNPPPNPAMLLPPFSVIDLLGQFVSGTPNQVSDLTGRYSTFTSKMILNCMKLLVNNGMHNNKRILSKTLMSTYEYPVHPPSLNKLERDSSTPPGSISIPVKCIFNSLGTAPNMGAWLSGTSPIYSSGWKTFGEPGINGTLIEGLGSQFATFTTFNSLVIFATLPDIVYGHQLKSSQYLEAKIQANLAQTRYISTQNMNVPTELMDNRIEYPFLQF